MTGTQLHYVEYFWSEYHDLERCSEWPTLREALARDHPEILHAWLQYKNAIATLTALVNALPDPDPDDV